MQHETPARGSAPLIPAAYIKPFILITVLFFLWGIPSNLNDILIRQFMKSFEITRLKAGLVQSAFYTGYFLFSIPAAMVMNRFGYKRGLLTGLTLYCLGTFLFLPAAYAGSYAFFLLALFVLASGLGFLETGANPLVTELGPPETAVRRLNLAQSFNPFGVIMGALIGTKFIFSGIEPTPAQIAAMKQAGAYAAYLHTETMRTLVPYLVLGAIVLVWAILIAATHFAVRREKADDAGVPDSGTYRRLLNYPHFLFAVVAQFCYVGAQVGTWSYFIQYAQDYAQLGEKSAGYLLTASLAAFCLGRFVSSYLMKTIAAETLMGVFALINIVLVAVAVLAPGQLGLGGLFLSSFFMSLMFPTIFALGLQGLGASTKAGASLLVMAIIGGAVLTPAIALVFQQTGSMAMAMAVPLACYVAVALYAFWGSRLPHRVSVEPLAQPGVF